MDKLINKKLKEFKNKFVGDNWRYGLSWSQWKNIKWWLIENLDSVRKEESKKFIELRNKAIKNPEKFIR